MWNVEERKKANYSSAEYHLSLAADLFGRVGRGDLVAKIDAVRNRIGSQDRASTECAAKPVSEGDRTGT